MPVMLRSKLAPKPVLSVPTRRLRFTSANTAATRAIRTNAAREKIDELLKLVANADRAIDEAVVIKEAACAEIEDILRGNNMSSHSNGVYLTEIVEQFTRQSRVVDPKKFRGHVESEAFWKAVKVNIEQAEKMLTEKELASITDVVPAKSMGFVFKIKEVPRKVRK